MRNSTIRKPTMTQKEKDREYLKEKLEEFLARGGVIEKCPPCARTEDIQYKHKFAKRGRKKKTED